MMDIQCTKELADYLKRKGKQHIVVDVATSNASDFEVSEIFLRMADDANADYLIRKKRFRAMPFRITGEDTGQEEKGKEKAGKVLLPPYRLEYDSVVIFDVKKGWFFWHLTVQGIRL